jgi:hypothetical protein
VSRVLEEGGERTPRRFLQLEHAGRARRFLQLERLPAW